MYFILIRTNMNVPEEIMKYGYYLLPISQTTVTFFIEVEGRFWTEMWAGSIYECGSSNECVPVHCQWCVCACVVVCEDRMPLWAYQTGCPWVQFSSVQSLSRVRLFATPRTTARQASLSITNSQSLHKLMSIESVMPSSHLILCRPLLLLPSMLASIRVFSNEPALRIR